MGFSRHSRVLLAMVGITLLLALTVDIAWHRESQNPNCHICKLCKMPFAEAHIPITVEPALLSEAASIPYHGRAVSRLQWAQSIPRSPPLSS